MGAAFATRLVGRLFLRLRGGDKTAEAPQDDVRWHVLPRAAQLYVVAIAVLGLIVLAAFVPRSYPRPMLFAGLLLLACVTSAWKVNLLIPLGSGSTLSPSEAANFMALALLGPQHAVVVAAAGVWTQCTVNVRRPYPLYRTLFSVAAEALTMAASGIVYQTLGGSLTAGGQLPLAIGTLAAALATCFLVNTGLVAGAIALSTRRGVLTVWRHDFLWSGVSFMVAGAAGTTAALVVDRDQYWPAVLLVPAYVTYRTYGFFVTRLEAEQRLTSGAVAVLSGRLEGARRQHEKAVERLAQARDVEHSLAEEKARLAAALAAMTRLEQSHIELLQREQAARARAEQANALKDQFLATVSHELRTPLTSVLGWADMLRRGVLDAATRDRAGRAIYIGAQRQAELIDDLLDVARITEGKLQLELTTVDLKDVVRTAVDAVQPNAEAKRIDIGIEEDPSIGVVHGDSGRLYQVATNLLANAVKFTPDGGEIQVRLRRAGDDVEMVVSDNGQGISPDFLPRLFEPFRQADAGSTRVHGGLGLGLSIAKHLVEAHGGSIRAESGGEGQGATFTVRLPAATAHDIQPVAIASDMSSCDALEEETRLLQGTCVLVVDDDDESRLVIGAHLEAHGARVVTAASAATALYVVQREHVDVIVADVGMPGEDGYALMRKIRDLPTRALASLPAAALTAFARDEDRDKALHAGFQLHLKKPVEARTLADAVAKLAGCSTEALEARDCTRPSGDPATTHTEPSR